MNKTIITFMTVSISLFSLFNAQTKAIGDTPLDLEAFNFNTGIAVLFPEKNKSKSYNNAYEINLNGNPERSIMVEKEATFNDKYGKDRKENGYEYHQKNWSNIDEVASFQTQFFQKINVATTLDGKIKVISGLADELTKTDSEKLLKLLTNKYVAYRKLKSSWNEKVVIYEWTKKDRIVRFATSYNDESNTMKIVVDQSKKTVTEGEKQPHFVGYLFIINPSLKSEIFGKMNSGDFVYLDDRKD